VQEEALMKRKKIKYEPFEITQSRLYAKAFLIILEGHLKYVKDPEGMLNDPQHRIFAIPFLDYARGDISFNEADRMINAIRSIVPLDTVEAWHKKFLRIQHEKISGSDLTEDIYSLESHDEKTAEASALRIVKSFPETQFKFPGVGNVIAKAIVDEDFFEAFDAIHSKRHLHAKRDLGLIAFKIFNEKKLNDPALREADVLRMADEQNLFYQSPAALFKYLRRAGIKIKSTERSQNPPSIAKRLEVFRKYFKNDVVNAKRTEFKKYLFGDTSIQKIKQGISILKKSLKLK
jgi:hypothetical protein